MDNTDRYSERIRTVAALVKPCRLAADIGCDHAFVPILLLQSGKAERAIASDVREGPLRRAEAHIHRAGLSDRIELRLGNGLESLREAEADCVIITGMGGNLMARILLQGAGKLEITDELVLSPHTEAELVREACITLGFRFTEEQMIREEGKYYTVFRAEKGSCEAPLSEAELRFGPLLIREKPPVFLRFLKEEEEKAGTLLRELSKQEKTESVREAIAKAEKQLGTVRGIMN